MQRGLHRFEKIIIHYSKIYTISTKTSTILEFRLDAHAVDMRVGDDGVLGFVVAEGSG